MTTEALHGEPLAPPPSFYEAVLRYDDGESAYEMFAATCRGMHEVQDAIHGHRIAMDGLKQQRRSAALTEYQAQKLTEHRRSRAALHSKNHALNAGRKALMVLLLPDMPTDRAYHEDDLLNQTYFDKARALDA